MSQASAKPQSWVYCTSSLWLPTCRIAERLRQAPSAAQEHRVEVRRRHGGTSQGCSRRTGTWRERRREKWKETRGMVAHHLCPPRKNHSPDANIQREQTSRLQQPISEYNIRQRLPMSTTASEMVHLVPTRASGKNKSRRTRWENNKLSATTSFNVQSSTAERGNKFKASLVTRTGPYKNVVGRTKGDAILLAVRTVHEADWVGIVCMQSKGDSSATKHTSNTRRHHALPIHLKRCDNGGFL